MNKKFSLALDRLSEYLAHRKGLLLILGIFFVLINGALQFFPGAGWVAQTDLFLHLGIVLALSGVLLAWAL